MSSVIIDLDGPREPPADTIRKLIYDAWQARYPDDNNIMIITENGKNDSNTPLSANDLKLLETVNTAYVRVYDVASSVIEQSNYMTYFSYDVYVDIFEMSTPAISAANNAQNRALMIRDVIDDIVMRRRIGPYYKASDNLNSGMTDIANRVIEWQRMSTSDEHKDNIKTESYHGIIECRFQRSVSSI